MVEYGTRKKCRWSWTVTCGILFVIVALAYFQEVYDIMFWKSKLTCGNKNDGQPFYFGTTDVVCMRMMHNRKKRAVYNTPASLPNRKFWSLTHRWIYYDGWYFELFYTPHTRRAAKSESCSSRREPLPAGYTKLEPNCVRRCAIYYNARFTKRYNTFTSNCHHYANKLAEIMCSHTTCPDWCNGVNLLTNALPKV
uniref:Uncharacterized protein LOC111109572 n=1 Tax=Crassostrea virginica TaxID=6565 RepID=A0A8B8BDH7_CRAVI|nr:uncharacterized protein LOC111109572 [Crassostrea virginica]XP_022301455.1 uncharacterized protein LOC111109572 [Crassostrea virginica]